MHTLYIKWTITYIGFTSHSYKLFHFVFSSPHKLHSFSSVQSLSFFRLCIICNPWCCKRRTSANMLLHVFLITASCGSNRIAFLVILDYVTIDPSLPSIPSSHITMMESVIFVTPSSQSTVLSSLRRVSSCWKTKLYCEFKVRLLFFIFCSHNLLT